MGNMFSRPVQHSKLTDILINVPQLADELEPADLRKLCRVSRDVRSAVDHPAVWRCQFAKLVGTRPRDLPESGVYTVTAPKPFKVLCKGVATARYMASAGDSRMLTDGDSFSVSAVHGYLREHFPESSAILTRVIEDLRRLEAQGKLPEDFWEMLAVSGGGTTLSAGGTALNVWGIMHVPAHVVAPPTLKIAQLVKLLGAKWTKVYLYSVYGMGVINGVLGVTMGVYLTVDTLLHAKDHYEERNRRMRDLRIQDLVSERRRIEQ